MGLCYKVDALIGCWKVEMLTHMCRYIFKKPDVSKLGGIDRIERKKYFGEMLERITLLFVREGVHV